MSKKKHVTVMCAKCKNLFQLGEKATWNSFKRCYICDGCAGVERDADGRAWDPGETEATFVNVGRPLSEAYVVTREEAFRGR